MKSTSLFLALAFVLSTVCGTSTAEDDEKGAWGHMTGQVLLTGDVPEIPDEKVTKDLKVCLASGKAPKDDNLVVGANGELRDVFVFMYRKAGDPVPAVHPSYEAKMADKILIDNVDCRFVPHAVFARVGQTLVLKNSDEAGHNCHITTFNNEHNVNLPANQEVEIKLAKADKAPGNVTCDIHDWMDGVILCRDEPYVAITGDDGKFTMENIPAGKWSFQFWHKKSGYLRKLEVENFEVGKRKGEIEVEIKDGETVDLGVMKLPSSALK